MVIFETIVGFTKQPGYVLSYLPAKFVLTAVVVASLNKPKYRLGLIVTVGAVNMISFVAWPALWDRAFFGTARTAHAIAIHDADISRIDAAIRTSYSPTEVVICHAEPVATFISFHLRGADSTLTSGQLWGRDTNSRA